MAPYTSTELYDALLAHAKTSLPDRETADRLASGLRDFSGLVAEKANVEAAAAAAGPTLLETASTTSAVGETVARAPVLLTSLLSAPFNVVIPIVLLLTGLVLCFAGTFLTLDRSRKVPDQKKPRYQAGEDSEDAKGKWAWESTGGLGGLVGGWIAGGQLATSATLWILNKTEMKLLSGVGFFIVWLMASAILAVLGVRYRFAAFGFLALLGSHALSMLLLLTFRLSTPLARLLPLPLFLAPLLLAYLPQPALRHHALRVSTAFAGSHAVTLAAALLLKRDWANGGTLLFVAGHSGLDWKSGSWKAFCAMSWLVGIAGYAVDTVLKAKLGENPDEEWSNYLSDYASRGLPTSTPRQGTFTPHLSPWARLLAMNKTHTQLADNEKDADSLKATSIDRQRRHPTDGSLDAEPLKLAKFRPSSSDSDSEQEDEKGDLGRYGGMRSTITPYPLKQDYAQEAEKRSASYYSKSEYSIRNDKYTSPPVPRRPTIHTKDSQATLVGSTRSGGAGPKGPRGSRVGGLVKRYDSISSISSVRKTSDSSTLSPSESPSQPPRREEEPESDWTPASRFDLPVTTSPTNAGSGFPLNPAFTSRNDPTTPAKPSRAALPTPPQSPPDAAPSLIQAYDRIARAHSSARAERMRNGRGLAGAREAEEMEERETKGEWESFWEEVRRKGGDGPEER